MTVPQTYIIFCLYVSASPLAPSYRVFLLNFQESIKNSLPHTAFPVPFQPEVLPSADTSFSLEPYQVTSLGWHFTLSCPLSLIVPSQCPIKFFCLLLKDWCPQDCSLHLPQYSLVYLFILLSRQLYPRYCSEIQGCRGE